MDWLLSGSKQIQSSLRITLIKAKSVKHSRGGETMLNSLTITYKKKNSNYPNNYQHTHTLNLYVAILNSSENEAVTIPHMANLDRTCASTGQSPCPLRG